MRTKTRHFFVHETPHRAYVNWIHAVEGADYATQLSRIGVPTLILTPDDDRLIGKDAAGILLGGIRQASEVVLPRSGHMFRFSHPRRYSEAVCTFLQSNIHAIGGAQ
jgi:pimeloyl-ACP methyl ester carboxylesterase